MTECRLVPLLWLLSALPAGPPCYPVTEFLKSSVWALDQWRCSPVTTGPSSFQGTLLGGLNGPSSPFSHRSYQW